MVPIVINARVNTTNNPDLTCLSDPSGHEFNGAQSFGSILPYLQNDPSGQISILEGSSQ